MDLSVFGAISYNKKYNLMFYKGRLNFQRFRQILVEYLKDFKRYEKDNFYIQMDNAPCHAGKNNKEYFESIGMKFIKHPPLFT